MSGILDPFAKRSSEVVAENAAWIRMMHSTDNLRAAAYTRPRVQLTVAEGSHHTTGEFGKRFAAGLLFIYVPTPARATPH